MLVLARMTKHPVTIRQDASVPDALKVMTGSKVRTLPVLSKEGDLVGIVTLEDVLRVSPSPATTLSRWEMEDALEKIKVERIMTKDVITITEQTPVEEAGRIMSDRGISGLPVMREGELVGLVTESDLFDSLLELLGARQSGLRVTVKMPVVKGALAKLTGAVSAMGGQFLAFGMTMDTQVITFRVRDVDRDELLKTIEPLTLGILDVREYAEE